MTSWKPVDKLVVGELLCANHIFPSVVGDGPVYSLCQCWDVYGTLWLVLFVGIIKFVFDNCPDYRWD